MSGMLEELISAIQELTAAIVSSGGDGGETETPPKRKAKAKAKAAPKKRGRASKKVEPEDDDGWDEDAEEDETEDEAEDEGEDEDEGPTLGDVREALAALQEEEGTPAVKKILTRLKAPSVAKIKPADFAKAIKLAGG